MLHDDRILLRLGLHSTGDRFSLLQKLRNMFGFSFVRFVAEPVTQLVADREVQKVRRRPVPLQQQFGLRTGTCVTSASSKNVFAFRIIRRGWGCLDQNSWSAEWLSSPRKCTNIQVQFPNWRGLTIVWNARVRQVPIAQLVIHKYDASDLLRCGEVMLDC